MRNFQVTKFFLANVSNGVASTAHYAEKHPMQTQEAGTQALLPSTAGVRSVLLALCASNDKKYWTGKESG